MTNLDAILIFLAFASLAIMLVMISSYWRRGRSIKNLQSRLNAVKQEKDHEMEVARRENEKQMEEFRRQNEERIAEGRRMVASADAQIEQIAKFLEKARFNNVQVIEISNQETAGVKAEGLAKAFAANGYKEITNFVEEPKDFCGMEMTEFAVNRVERWLSDTLKKTAIDNFQIAVIVRSAAEPEGYKGWLLAKEIKKE